MSPTHSTSIALFHHFPMALAPDIDHEAEAVIGSDLKIMIEKRALKHLVGQIPAGFGEWVQAIMEEWWEGGSKDKLIAEEADILDRAFQLDFYEQIKTFSISQVLTQYDFFNSGRKGEWQKQRLAEYDLFR